MRSFKQVTHFLLYCLDNLKSNKLLVKIEHFDIDKDHHILVIYRLGQRKLLHKSMITQFQKEYFNKTSLYDQQRLTKFATYQTILDLLQDTPDALVKAKLARFIKDEAKNEQLF